MSEGAPLIPDFGMSGRLFRSEGSPPAPTLDPADLANYPYCYELHGSSGEDQPLAADQGSRRRQRSDHHPRQNAGRPAGRPPSHSRRRCGRPHPSDQPRPRSPDRRRAERTGTALGVKRAKEKGGSHYGSPLSLNLKSSIAHSKGISTASIHFISSIKS